MTIKELEVVLFKLRIFSMHKPLDLTFQINKVPGNTEIPNSIWNWISEIILYANSLKEKPREDNKTYEVQESPQKEFSKSW